MKKENIKLLKNKSRIKKMGVFVTAFVMGSAMLLSSPFMVSAAEDPEGGVADVCYTKF